MIKCEHKLFPKLNFRCESERKTFYDYIDFKGLFLHKHVYEVYLQYQETVSYHGVSTYIRYDKGLRNVLYRNLSAVEEYYRSRLINSFDINRKLTDFKKDIVKNSELVESNGESSNLYNYSFCKSFSFDKLLNMLNTFSLLNDIEKAELNRIREFRNKVMHHNLVIISSHITKNDIENEIKEVEQICGLIYKHLPRPMRNAFEVNINTCNHLTNNSRIPNLDILCVREMKNGIFS